MIGFCKKWNEMREYGFVQGNNITQGKDVYFRRSDIVNPSQIDILGEGTKLDFELNPERFGKLSAKCIKILDNGQEINLGDDEDSEEDIQKAVSKYKTIRE